MMTQGKENKKGWNWTTFGVYVAIAGIAVSMITLLITFFNVTGGLENRLSTKIDNGNHRTDKVYEIIIEQQRQIGKVETSQEVIEKFIEEHEEKHAHLEQ